MAVDFETSRNAAVQRWSAWARRHRLGGRFAIAVAIAALLCGIATWIAISPGLAEPLIGADGVRVLLLVDLVLALALLALVSWRVVRLWTERRRGAAGARLHTRIVALFSIVAMVPAVIMAVFSALFFQFGLQTWFSERVNTAVRGSVAVAESYVQEHAKTITTDALAIAADINRESSRLSRNPNLFNQFLSAQVRVRNLGEAIVFTRAGQILARSELTLALEFERMSTRAVEQADRGEVALLQSESEDRVRALVKLDGLLDTYLFIGRFVDPRVIDYLERTRQAARQYAQLEQARSRIEITFAMFFIVVSLLLLLVAIWFALSIATRLVKPVGELVGASERVRQGDLDARVPESGTDDEMDLLGRSFNRMTAQLAAQRAELVEANRSLDERRRFTETVLAGVSAGVIGVDPEGRMTLPNRTALEILGLAAEEGIGQPLAQIFPELAELLAEAMARQDRDSVQGNLGVVRGGRTRNLAAKISRERLGGETIGFVVTFDDISDLVSAQRTAAWADVARRIAHEIKNPLTPIQLSAERLKRKYLREVQSDQETFLRCTDTIIRQVGDIGRMVDEFSAFARMPAPTFRTESAVELVRQAVFLQQVANPEVAWTVEVPDDPVPVRCDGRQMAQVLVNLLKNAIEAIEGRAAADEGLSLPRGTIHIDLHRRDDGMVVIQITDNGKGLPQEDRNRLTEPYVTTRTKGTGLGLAIVKKIMEEHGGQLVLADAPAQADGHSAAPGARISLVLPAAAENIVTLQAAS